MRGDRIEAKLLSAQEIPNADPALLAALGVPEGYMSLGILTTDIDDVSYAAMDEATKKAEVTVVYAKSMYAGSSNASTLLAGEFIGILAGPDPAEVRSGMEAFISYIENEAFFYSADDEGKIPYFAHCISRSGSYLSEQCKVPEGTPIAYLIAPPDEAICGIDAALKAADVQMRVFYGPPTETNFAGALLTGTQAACKAACEAFAARVMKTADAPVDLGNE
ncbi:MAG: ethanolamine utilization microcompartment protein EutL [Lachnospiraceae bacterium]|nr:ethanolamine utilization microcompartment protein EutL [Lachnospiraceae bacterium]